MIRISLLFLLLISFSYTTISAQIQDKVNFENGEISIEIHPEHKKIYGIVDYTFEVLNAIDSIFLDAINIEFSSVLLNRKKVKYSNTNNHLIVYKKLKKGAFQTLTLEYTATPKQTVYFVGYDDTSAPLSNPTSTLLSNRTSPSQNNSTSMTDQSRSQTKQNQTMPAVRHGLPAVRQVWTQGQGKYTSHWLPSFDDMNEKVEFDLNITFDAAYQVIANGKLVATSNEEPKSIMWSFDMQKPMSSYLLAFAIGNYDKKTIASASGIPIELYYYPQDSLRVEPTYRHTKSMFDFLETEIGLRYPWQNYKQVPVKDFLYAGMENTTATIFSDAYVIDTTAFIDKNYVNVNAHELAHQWFGNLVTATDGNHHWLQEGFSTYYALLAEKEVFGADYFYWKLHKTAEQLQAMSRDNKGEALTDAKASSLTFYEKGAWALVALRNQLGENAFKTGIKNYLETYKFKNVTIQNFLAEMEQASGKNLGTFESVWLSNTNFPTIEAKTYLKNNSESLAAYFELQEKLENTTDKAEKLNFITEIYGKTNSTTLKSTLISKYFTLLPEEFIKNVFLSNEIELRQAIILATDSIPETLKSDYETLLDDKSYLTLESALYKLWVSFPEDQKKYLDATDGVVGLPNKNVRLLWLTLAIASQNYNGLKTKEYFDELTSYTNSRYGTETRQTAFTYLYQTLGLTDANLKDLADASVHHSWQFKKFVRNLIDELVKDADYKNRIKELVLTLNIEEQRYIKSKL